MGIPEFVLHRCALKIEFVMADADIIWWSHRVSLRGVWEAPSRADSAPEWHRRSKQRREWRCRTSGLLHSRSLKLRGPVFQLGLDLSFVLVITGADLFDALSTELSLSRVERYPRLYET